LTGASASAGSSSSSSASERYLLTMSALTEDGVMAVKQTACDRLLNFRVELKVSGKRIGDVLNKMHVALPKTRDAVSRPPVIPASVAAARAAATAGAAKPKRKTEKDLQEEHGGAGITSDGQCRSGCRWPGTAAAAAAAAG
jgi:nucleolar GTP-binding protein